MRILLLFILLFQLSACKQTGGEDASSGFGVKIPDFSQNGSQNPFTPKMVRVQDINGGAVDNHVMAVGDFLELRAGIIDYFSNTFQPMPVNWSLVGSTIVNTAYPNSDLVVDPIDGSLARYIANTPGSLSISVSYSGTDPSILARTDSTGKIFVTSNSVADSLIVVGGTGQSTMVDSAYGSTFDIKALDQYGQGLESVLLEISVFQGNGSIVGASQILTDSNGIANFTAKAGTIVGSGNNIYKIHIVSQPGIFTYVSASATPGVFDHLSFIQSPGESFQSVVFLDQPIVEARDVFNNRVDLNGTVNLTKATGAGDFIGNPTATMSHGLAVFSNLAWDTKENNVSFTAQMLTKSTTCPLFNVSFTLPGACLINDSSFKSRDGGCKDLDSNLIWSKAAPSGMSWSAAIWDAYGAPGSSAPDAEDFGRTNDRDESDLAKGTDSSALAYCKDLIEGGYSDWRMPTKAEYQAMANRGGKNYLNTVVNNTYYWTATTDYAIKLSHSNNAESGFNPNNGFGVFCVRGGDRAINVPHHISVKSLPSYLVKNEKTTADIVVKVKNINGDGVNVEGLTLQLVPSVGTITNGATAVTDYQGVASFKEVRINDSGNISFDVIFGGATPTLIPTSFSIEVKPFKQFCANPDSRYQTADGGCKDTLNNLVWSSRSKIAKNWFQMVWDQTKAGSSSQKLSDNGRTNDYGNDCGTVCDKNDVGSSSGESYCHDLVEGGYSDWRFPSVEEISVFDTDQIFMNDGNGAIGVWTSSQYEAVPGGGYYFNLSTKGFSWDWKTNAYYSLCVRGPGPFNRDGNLQLTLEQASEFLPNNSKEYTPIIIQIKDGVGNKVFAEGLNVTMSVADPDLGIQDTVTYSSNHLGKVVINDFKLIAGVEKMYQFDFTAPGVTSISKNITVKSGINSLTCYPETGRFKNQNGGCHDTSTDLVWGSFSKVIMTWGEVVWDSTQPGNVQPDLNDTWPDNSTRLDDIDHSRGVPHASLYDNSTSNYCHDLVEAGYSDWRAPTYAELRDVWITGLATKFYPKPKDAYVWTSSPYSAGDSRAIVINLFNGGENVVPAGYGYYAICVRKN